MHDAVLFVPFYTPANNTRAEELFFSLRQNIQHTWLKRIVLMIDDDTFLSEEPPDSKIVVERFDKRPTYADWLTLTLEHAADASFSICANADIELSVNFLEQILAELKSPRMLLCISRYDILTDGKVELRSNPQWTQDTWCIRPQEAAAAAKDFHQELRIPFGIPRCDNRLPYVFWLRGWLLANPCYRAKTLHHQLDQARTYSKKDTSLLGGVAFVHPSLEEAGSSKIDIDIFSLNQSGPGALKHNNWLLSADLINANLQAERNHPAQSMQAKVVSLSLNGKKLELTGSIARGNWRPIYSYNDRFKIYQEDSRIAFVDRKWPSLLSYDDPGIASFSPEQLNECFLWGFCSPAIEFLPNHFAGKKLHPEDQRFWQYPCRTEQDAFSHHAEIYQPALDKYSAHSYIGLPWATWIDLKICPTKLIEAYGSRISAMRTFLKDLGINFHAHTVCQHIYWHTKESIALFQSAGVSDLWISHKEKGYEQEGGVNLHAWPLYAVNVLEPERQCGLGFIPTEQKDIFASFKGAYMKHYLSDARLLLGELSSLDGYNIQVTDMWHFNKFVYDFQVNGKNDSQNADDPQGAYDYNRLLSRSLFSLCPVGAGPNTLRLWESLAIGAIPVILSDRYEFPDPLKVGLEKDAWQQAVIALPEAEISQLDSILKAIPQEKLDRMQAACRRLFEAFRQMTCF